MRDAKERVWHDEEEAMALRVEGGLVAAETLKWRRVRRGGREVRRGVSKSGWWTVCSIPILSSCTYCRSGAAGALPIWQSPESFGLNPYWLIQPKLLSPSFFPSRSDRQVGTGGLKRNQATVSCRSSQQSYLVWACHLSGQWMHEIREGEEEENVSTTGGDGGSTGGALGGAKGCRGREEWVTCKKNESKN